MKIINYLLLLGVWGEAQGSGIHDSIVSVIITRQNTVNITTGGHVAFPSVTRMQNDSLLIIYRKGNTHVDPTGRIMKQFGSPDGLTWSTPQILYNDSVYDDRDPSIHMLSNGKVVMNYFKYNKGNNTVNPPIPAFFSVFYSESYDNGQTFSTPISLDNTILNLPSSATYDGMRYLDSNGERFESYATSSPIIEVNNKLVLPAYGGETLVYQSLTGCYSTDKQRIVFFESDDDGVTWNKRFINETELTNSWLTEPSLIRLNDGTVLMQIRSSDNPCTPGGMGPLRQAESADEAEEFSSFQNFPMVGHAPDLYQLSNGVLLSGFRWYNNLMNSQKTAFIYSINNGKSWSDTLLVSDCMGECGYPSFVELSDSKFMVSFYTAFGQAISGVIYDIAVGIENIFSPDLVSVSEKTEPEDLMIFPNPSSGIFSLNYENMSEGHTGLRIFNLTGNEVHKEEFYQSPGRFSRDLNLENISKGVYFVEITSENNSLIKKIIIQ